MTDTEFAARTLTLDEIMVWFEARGFRCNKWHGREATAKRGELYLGLRDYGSFDCDAYFNSNLILESYKIKSEQDVDALLVKVERKVCKGFEKMFAEAFPKEAGS